MVGIEMVRRCFRRTKPGLGVGTRRAPRRGYWTHRYRPDIIWAATSAVPSDGHRLWKVDECGKYEKNGNVGPARPITDEAGKYIHQSARTSRGDALLEGVAADV